MRCFSLSSSLKATPPPSHIRITAGVRGAGKSGNTGEWEETLESGITGPEDLWGREYTRMHVRTMHVRCYIACYLRSS